MRINKQTLEKTAFIFVIIFILLNAYCKHDSIAAIISAICGITYTVYAGKGRPFCYLFGICGSGFYGFLSFQNALWGNLLLYVCYYIPMQIAGFFKWNKHLKLGKNEIIKTKLSLNELFILIFISLLLIILACLILMHYNDTHPILDSITTVLSLGGMYLTVKRAIEQWIFWIIVNAVSLYMWLSVALSGMPVWSTVLMWTVYLFLAFYFYFEWKHELNRG